MKFGTETDPRLLTDGRDPVLRPGDTFPTRQGKAGVWGVEVTGGGIGIVYVVTMCYYPLCSGMPCHFCHRKS